MTLEVLCTGGSTTEHTQLTTLPFGYHFLVRDGLEILADPETTGEACGTLGWQDVVGSDNLCNTSF